MRQEKATRTSSHAWDKWTTQNVAIKIYFNGHLRPCGTHGEGSGLRAAMTSSIN